MDESEANWLTNTLFAFANVRHWRDIDLFVGGISERRISDAAFGPTFACINGIQFYHFKFGDRFYFEHGNQAGSFSPGTTFDIANTHLNIRTHKLVIYPVNTFIQQQMHVIITSGVHTLDSLIDSHCLSLTDTDRQTDRQTEQLKIECQL